MSSTADGVLGAQLGGSADGVFEQPSPLEVLNGANEAPTGRPVVGPARALGGSAVGREHVRLGRNNQDAFCVRSKGERVVGVVSDGCGSQPSAEVGARLGAQWLAQWLVDQPIDASLADRAVGALAAWVGGVAAELGAGAVETFFLFTVLAVVREGRRTLVFGAGDGGVWVDGVRTRLDAGVDNAPDYGAYRLTSAAKGRAQVHFEGDCDRVAVMTDGLDQATDTELEALVAPASNPLAVQRRLNVLAESRRLHDDATVVVLSG